MKTKLSYLQLMRRFEEALIAMSAFAHRTVREEWMGTSADDRKLCLDALSQLAHAWEQSTDDLQKLQSLTERCVNHYAKGELDEGDFAVKEIVEFLYDVRSQPKKHAARRLPQ